MWLASARCPSLDRRFVGCKAIHAHTRTCQLLSPDLLTKHTHTQGTIKHMHFTHVETFADAIKYVRSLGCTVCGIEIVPQAKPIQVHALQRGR